MRRTKLTLAALLILSPLAAGADLIEINEATDSRDNGVWDVTLVDGTFADLEAILTTQVWWGDDIVARLFADALGVSADNVGFGLADWGPLFAVTRTFINGLELHAGQYCFDGACDATSYDNLSVTKAVTFATADRIPVPEPTTLVLLAFGLCAIGATCHKRFFMSKSSDLHSR